MEFFKIYFAIYLNLGPPVPFELAGKGKTIHRGTIIIKLSTESLAVFSSVEKLGILRNIVALNIKHYFVSHPGQALFPGTKVIGMKGLPKKGKKTRPQGGGESECEYVDSRQNRKQVFFHKPTRTLIKADLIFNLPATEQYSRTMSSASSSVLFATGLLCAERDVKWQRRIVWYLSCSGDREGFTQSTKRILTWNFRRIIPCHGGSIENWWKGSPG
ncbi:hypothetical protein BGZ60DRAFT_472927 [Tricladium varicosporioides]|nr:hypothetical protein BGZ60DRAFT_472927 [Hymenoscyphus varicosporioides]